MCEQGGTALHWRLHTAVCFATSSLPLVVFGVYARTAYPTVSGGDSGELLTCVCNWGVAHPPGYPLWTWMAISFSHGVGLFFPDSDIAWRVNIFSAVCNSLASAMLMVVVTKLVEIKGPKLVDPKFKPEVQQHELLQRSQAYLCAALSAGLFAFSPGVWLYAIQAEVFGLNNLLISLVLCALVFFGNVNRRQIHQILPLAYCGAFFSGLALSNQHTTALYVAPIACWVLYQLWAHSLFTASAVLKLGLCGLAGLLPYTHLPLASKFSPVPQDAWGDSSTVDGFLTHFLRREYGTFVLASTHELGSTEAYKLTWTKFCKWVGHIQSNTAVLRSAGLPLAVFGSICSVLLPLCFGATKTGGAKLRPLLATGPARPVPRLMLFSLALYIGVISALANLPIDNAFHLGILARMWQQADIIVYIFIGVGVHQLADGATALAGRMGGAVPAAAVPTALAAVVAALVSQQCLREYPGLDQHANFHFRDYGLAALESAPKGAVVLVNEDVNSNSMKYVQQCQGRRTDLRVVSIPLMTYKWWRRTQLPHHPGLEFPGARHHPYEQGSFSMRAFLDANLRPPPQQGTPPPKKRSLVNDVYVAGLWKSGDSSQDVYRRVPHGLLDRVRPPLGAKPEGEAALKAYLKQLQRGRKRRAAAGVPAGGGGGVALRPPPPGVSTPESWERVLQVKIVNAMHGPAHYIAQRYGMAKSAKTKQKALGVARHTYSELHAVMWADGNEHLKEALQKEVWRNAGIIAGEYAQFNSSATVIRQMFTFWRAYLELSNKSDPGAVEIQRFLDERVNPYTGKRYTEDGELLEN